MYLLIGNITYITKLLELSIGHVYVKILWNLIESLSCGRRMPESSTTVLVTLEKVPAQLEVNMSHQVLK